jgi:hypothetical protein
MKTNQICAIRFQGFSDGEHTPQARRYRWRVVRP